MFSRSPLDFLVKTVAIITALLLMLLYSSVVAEFIEPRTMVYGYRVDLAHLGITPRYVSVVDGSRVMVIGSIGGTYGVAILNIANPYSDPIIEDLYPLTGAPTHITTDGYPITRIAIGSDKGEILVFKVDTGRITRHLYVVLGADFYVDRVFLAKGIAGDVKIIAFVVEGGSRGYPCMNCYIYVLDEEGQGILRIGPRTGNATLLGRELEGINIQHVAPLAVYGVKDFYWDASNVIIAYIPQVIKLVLNIAYVDKEVGELKPLPNTLVEIVLRPKDGNETIVYGVNADTNGIARIPVPIERDRALVVDLLVRDINGIPLWNYTYILDPKQLERILMISDEILLPSLILETTYVDTRPAAKVYGMPPFLSIKLDLVDLTLAPFGCIRKGSANFLLSPSVTALYFVKGEAEPKAKIIHIDPSAGRVGISIASIGSSIIREAFIDDYVGTGVTIVDSITYVDGGYIVVGLTDGRIRVYVHEERGYRLRNIYTMGSHIVNLIAIPNPEGYTYVAVSSNGIQVLRIDPYPLPIFRSAASLYLATPRYIHGDALADLTTIVLVDPEGITIIRNGYLAMEGRVALRIDKFMARDLELYINMPGGEDVNGTIVIFRYPGGYIKYRLTTNILTIRNIIPSVNYTIEIYPPKDYIYNGSITFRLSRDLLIEFLESHGVFVDVEGICCRITVSMRYMEYTVKLRILDEISGSKLIAPIDVYVNGKTIALSTYSSEHIVKLLYGVHNISVVSSVGFSHAYNPQQIVVSISRDLEIDIRIERVKYKVTLSLVDGLTKSAPIAPIEIEIWGLVYSVTTDKPYLDIVLPYGNYTAVIRPAKGYEGVYTAKVLNITVSPRTLTYNIEMNRKIYRVELNIRDPYTLNLIAPVDIYVNGSPIRLGVIRGVEVLDIPYGLWILSIAPSKGYGGIYDVSSTTLYISGDTRLEIDVPRAIYTITINIIDVYRRIVSPIDIAVEGPIAVVQTVEPPGRSIELLLPYGEYSLKISPHNTSIYIPYTTKFVANSSKSITIAIQRVKYRLDLRIVDRFGVIGRFMLYANDTKIAENIGREALIDMPYGVYSLKLMPMPGWIAAYEETRPMLVSIAGNTSLTVYVNRKLYRLRIVVMERGSPIANAIVYIYSLESGELLTSLITDANGVVETNLPYGVYRVAIRHEQYVYEEIPVITVSRDISEIVSLRPTVLTLLWRYMPIIGALVGTGVAIYVVLRIRAIIARRLVEEEIF